MKIQFIKEEKLNELKANIKTLSRYFAEEENNDLLHELGNDIFEDSQFNIDSSIELDMSIKTPNENKTDAHNAILLHNKLKGISNSIASDERLWAGLCIGPFWKYSKYRWNMKDAPTISQIMQHFFFDFNDRRSLTRNSLSRLWWAANLTYDKELDNPYELTEFICSSQRYIGDILERNFSNNRIFLKTFLNVIIDLKQKYSINTNHIRELAKYIDEIGGIYILDCLSEQIIRDKICKKVEAWHKQEKVKLA